MQLIDATIKPDSNIFLIGDTHEGARLFDSDGWAAFIEMMHSPYEDCKANYYVDHGDAIEGIHVDDKRYGIDETTESRTLLQMDEAVKRRKPIASKCLCMLTGNHEYKLQKFGDISARMARDLSVPYGTYSAKLTYRNGGSKILFKHFATHGYGTMNHQAGDEEQRLANMRVKLKRMLRFKAADTYLMSMGHCFTDDTEMLTPNGWKLHKDIKEGLPVLTLNVEKGFSEWNIVNKKYEYNGIYKNAIEFSSQSIDFCVTEDHRVIYKHHKCNWSEKKAKELIGKSQFIIPTSGKSACNDNRNISDYELKLIGWLVSEGHFRGNGSLQLFQNQKESYKIKDVLDNLNIKYSVYKRNFKGRKFKDPRTKKEYSVNDDCDVFYIAVNDAKEILKYISTKKIPDIIWSISDRQFDVFFYALMDGDGWLNKSKISGVYYTKDKEIVDDLQSILSMHGWSSKFKIRKNTGCYDVVVNKRTERIFYNKDRSLINNVVPSNIVWCVSVDNGTVFIRRNGKVSVLGNTHQLLTRPPLIKLNLIDDGRKLRQVYDQTPSGYHQGDILHEDMRWYCNTGCFLKTMALGYSGYAERAGYNPNTLGFGIALVRGGKIVNVREEKI
jgi:hypothetical protein